MRVLIIENEIHSFNNLHKILLRIEPLAKIDGPITNLEDMKVSLQHQNNYDVIFSDIRLDDGVCFEALAEVEITTPLIFTTAYDEYALEAFKTGGIDYLLKPIEQEYLKKAIEKSKKMKRGQQNLSVQLQNSELHPSLNYRYRFLIEEFDGAHILNVDDISHITKEDSRILAYLNDGTRHKFQEKSLDTIESQLNPLLFFRVNRQYIINIHSILKISHSFRQTLKLKLKHYLDLNICISKDRATKLKEWIEQ